AWRRLGSHCFRYSLGVSEGLLLNSVRWSMCSCKGQNLRNYFTNCARRSPDNLPTDAGSIPAISTCESPGSDTDPGLFLVPASVADGCLPADRVRRAFGRWGGDTVDRRGGETGRDREQACGVGVN